MKYKAPSLRLRTSIAALSLAFIIGGIQLVPSANAHEGHTDEHTATTEVPTETKPATQVDRSDATAKKTAAEAEAKERRDTMQTAAKEHREAAKEKLSATKLQICKDRKAHIDTRVTRISERATKHLALFDSIAERVQAFYVTKGNTLENYDELVADMGAKKAAAETAVEALEAQKGGFDCEGTNPKSAITTYKTTLLDTIAVLKEYRTSVKNLIVGVKSVNATDQATKTTEDAQ
ncbi:MAG: hypothetical protein JWM07_659 [Candidatus Saccharibacteria bacterium]|nr:hypothetical protein [Candidatus Saccharibacteria bacterium]